MKKILLIIIAVFLACGITYAKGKKTDMPSIKFNGGEYYLYYSAKDDKSGGYINEYYKANQSYTSWKDLIALWHYPNSYSPVEQAKKYREILSSDGIPCSLDIDEDDNAAVIDFTLIASKKLPIIVEYNVFKFAKQEKCGSVALQYAKRYRLNNSLEIDKAKKDIVKRRKKIIKKVNKLEFPQLLNESVDEGKIITHEGTNQNYDKEFK